MATRESLLDVTARLYAEHGWRGTTTRRIAEAAGVNEVTVFRQFGSKESLLLAAIGNAADHGIEVALPEQPVDPTNELLIWAMIQHQAISARRGIIRSCLAEFEERPALAPAACEGGERARHEVTAYLERAHQSGLVDGDIHSAASLLTHGIFVDAMMRDMPVAHQRPDVDVTLRGFIGIVLRGLGLAS